MTKKYVISHYLDIEVPFFDVDSMYIVWHGHYVKYLELARCSLLDAIQHDYLTMKAEGYAWPIVKMNFKYIKPARFKQKIRVYVHLLEFESSLQCDYQITDLNSGVVLTKASTTQVAVDIKTGEMQFVTPASWQAAVRHYMMRS